MSDLKLMNNVIQKNPSNTVKLEEVGWTDEARAAAALARQQRAEGIKREEVQGHLDALNKKYGYNARLVGGVQNAGISHHDVDIHFDDKNLNWNDKNLHSFVSELSDRSHANVDVTMPGDTPNTNFYVLQKFPGERIRVYPPR